MGYDNIGRGDTGRRRWRIYSQKWRGNPVRLPRKSVLPFSKMTLSDRVQWTVRWYFRVQKSPKTRKGGFLVSWLRTVPRSVLSQYGPVFVKKKTHVGNGHGNCVLKSRPFLEPLMEKVRRRHCRVLLLVSFWLKDLQRVDHWTRGDLGRVTPSDSNQTILFSPPVISITSVLE